MANEINVVITDDHPALRKGLRQVIEGHPKLKIVAEADDGEAALAQIEKLKPDIAVLDVDMPKLDGFGVVFLTIHRRPLPRRHGFRCDRLHPQRERPN